MSTTHQQIALYTDTEKHAVAGIWVNLTHERAGRLLRRLKYRYGNRPIHTLSKSQRYANREARHAHMDDAVVKVSKVWMETNEGKRWARNLYNGAQ